ncbi:Na+/H+ antiporter NhaC family protein, partial [Cetobacterium somerae]|uniref:Na+/H+ antiporter NhaC family protein n=1 Tax=Cetobacterium sp. NK01 TaxID=2993530 RepID=UPI002115DBE6
MEEQRSKRNYKLLAFIPMFIFLGLYVGCGIYFTIKGVENPFGKMSRYIAVLIAVCVGLVCYDKKESLDKKIDIYARGAGKSGIMILGIIVLMAGGFQSVTTAMGGKASIVNMGLSLIPTHFLIPGIFIITCCISLCIGTSMGTQVAMIPVAIAVATGAGLDVAMAGAATIAGAYFGDNLSMISDTTICATKGVGAEMKDKFKMNFLIALPAAIITIFLYTIYSMGAITVREVGELQYNILEILPYITVLITAILGINVILVLGIGIVMSGIIGISLGNLTFFGWAMAVSSGMEDMFFLAIFASLISGMIELIKYYGGIDWLVEILKSKINGRKSCEYFISLISMTVSGATLNNPVAIIITAPIAKELGSRYKIAPKRLASILDIFSCAILGLVPHDSSVLLLQKYGGITYLQMMKYSFYPILLMLFTIITIQFGLLRTKEEKQNENTISNEENFEYKGEQI